MTRAKQADENLLKDVGQRIKNARSQRGMTQENLSAAIGVQPETVSRYERGAIPISLSQLLLVSEALEVGVDILLGLNSKGLDDRQNEILERWNLLDKQGRELIFQLLRKLTSK